MSFSLNLNYEFYSDYTLCRTVTPESYIHIYINDYYIYIHMVNIRFIIFANCPMPFPAHLTYNISNNSPEYEPVSVDIFSTFHCTCSQ